MAFPIGDDSQKLGEDLARLQRRINALEDVWYASTTPLGGGAAIIDGSLVATTSIEGSPGNDDVGLWRFDLYGDPASPFFAQPAQLAGGVAGIKGSGGSLAWILDVNDTPDRWRGYTSGLGELASLDATTPPGSAIGSFITIFEGTGFWWIDNTDPDFHEVVNTSSAGIELNRFTPDSSAAPSGTPLSVRVIGLGLFPDGDVLVVLSWTRAGSPTRTYQVFHRYSPDGTLNTSYWDGDKYALAGTTLDDPLNPPREDPWIGGVAKVFVSSDDRLYIVINSTGGDSEQFLELTVETVAGSGFPSGIPGVFPLNKFPDDLVGNTEFPPALMFYGDKFYIYNVLEGQLGSEWNGPSRFAVFDLELDLESYVDLKAPTQYNAGEQTEWFRYPSSFIAAKESAGTPDGGVSVPALDFYTAQEHTPRWNYMNDLRTALQAVLQVYRNPATAGAYNFTPSSANNLYHVAVEAGQYTYDVPVYDAQHGMSAKDFNELHLMVAQLEASEPL